MLGRMEDTNNNATELINENEILISTKIPMTMLILSDKNYSFGFRKNFQKTYLLKLHFKMHVFGEEKKVHPLDYLLPMIIPAKARIYGRRT